MEAYRHKLSALEHGSSDWQYSGSSATSGTPAAGTAIDGLAGFSSTLPGGMATATAGQCPTCKRALDSMEPDGVVGADTVLAAVQQYNGSSSSGWPGGGVSQVPHDVLAGAVRPASSAQGMCTCHCTKG